MVEDEYVELTSIELTAVILSPGINCLRHGINDGKHHSRGGGVGDPHGEKHGGDHEAKHQSGLKADMKSMSISPRSHHKCKLLTNTKI